MEGKRFGVIGKVTSRRKTFIRRYFEGQNYEEVSTENRNLSQARPWTQRFYSKT